MYGKIQNEQFDTISMFLNTLFHLRFPEDTLVLQAYANGKKIHQAVTSDPQPAEVPIA